ncbi:MAG: DUF2924 domain-containing protein [Rhodovibrionaceae bacterium]
MAGKSPHWESAAQALDAELAALPRLSRVRVVARWKQLFGTPPPKGMSRRLLIGTIAYEAQVKAHSKPSAAFQRRLKRSIDGAPASRRPKRQKLAAGAQMIREWNGVTHVVMVTDRGYFWGGSTYRSLSAIAREITGAHWSGPRFFGVKS